MGFHKCGVAMTTIAPDRRDTRRMCETFGCPNPGERMYQLAPATTVWLCSECSTLGEDADVGKYDRETDEEET